MNHKAPMYAKSSDGIIENIDVLIRNIEPTIIEVSMKESQVGGDNLVAAGQGFLGGVDE